MVCPTRQSLEGDQICSTAFNGHTKQVDGKHVVVKGKLLCELAEMAHRSAKAVHHDDGRGAHLPRLCIVDVVAPPAPRAFDIGKWPVSCVLQVR